MTAPIFSTISTLCTVPPARTPRQLTTVSAASATEATAQQSEADAHVTPRYDVGGTVARTLIMRYNANQPLIPVSIVSRKTHGTAGDFDIELPFAGNPVSKAGSPAPATVTR